MRYLLNWLMVSVLFITFLSSIALGESNLPAATSALLAGEYEAAIALFQAENTRDPLCAISHAGEGAAQLLRGDRVTAQRSFDAALTLAPSLTSGHLGRALLACQDGEYQRALDEYHAAMIGGPRKVSTTLAGQAYAACGLGLYDTALQQAQAALVTDPLQPVARFVYSAASLAKGDAISALKNLPPASIESGILLASCLFNPQAAYGRMRNSQLAAVTGGLPPLAPVTLATTVPDVKYPEATSADFAFARPAVGETVTGMMTITLRVGEGVELDHVLVLLNDTFVGVTSVQPFNITVPRSLLSDGLCTLRVDGYDRQGQVVRSISRMVKIQLGNRTLSPQEVATRAAVAEVLEGILLPPVSLAAQRQLAGYAFKNLGRLDEAASAFESGYVSSGDANGLRDDLLLIYRTMGLDVRSSAPEISSMPHGSKRVALTFDDGPHPLITPWILDQLDKAGVKATFFLVGKQVTLYPELAREIKRRGHVIAAHSYAHYSLRHLSAPECEQDLVKCRLAIREACGETVRLFRPPGGYYDSTVQAAAGALGYTTVFWTANITSFPGGDGKRIGPELARQCAEGGIILLHNGEDETLDTLPHLLGEIKRRGLSCVTLAAEDAGEPRLARERLEGGS